MIFSSLKCFMPRNYSGKKYCADSTVQVGWKLYGILELLLRYVFSRCFQGCYSCADATVHWRVFRDKDKSLSGDYKNALVFFCLYRTGGCMLYGK